MTNVTRNRRFAERTLGLFALLALASCFGEKTTGPEMRRGMFAFAPILQDRRALAAVSVDHVHIVIKDSAGTTVVLDTTIVFPASADTLDLAIPVPLIGNSETFALTLDMLDASNNVVFHSGPSLVVATAAGVPPPVSAVVLTYVGTGANAKGVRFISAPGWVFFGDSVTFVAEAFDSNNVTIPNTPILYSAGNAG
ncbi:MAG: hypothetical protein ACHQU1_12335, partial [Gemmatimonadales bacterium]